MAITVLPAALPLHMASSHPKIKKESPSGDDYRPPKPPTSPAIPIADVMTVNENWRGKNDPAERRRIQNRLNQRAFRQRQRAGESPKQYKARSGSGCSSGHKDDSDDEADSPRSEDSLRDGPLAGAHDGYYPTSAPSEHDRPRSGSAAAADAQGGYVWDELAQLINRNFISAAVTNAQHVGIDLDALQSGTAILTPRPSSPSSTPQQQQRAIPATLRPVELQHQLSHDPIIDTLPHARLRFNILRGIAAGHVDAPAFSRCIRASGALEQLGGMWQRGGVVVWSSAEQAVELASWELSEPFVRRWAFLLQGCEDLIAATNAWRGRRGEMLFPTSFSKED